jgi:hypothetical protein
MPQGRFAAFAPARRALACLLLVVPTVASTGCNSGAPPGSPSVRSTDPWKAPQLMLPAQLAKVLADSTAARPVLLHVGFRALYRAGAIPGSIYVGAGSTESGIAGLREAVKDLPRDRDVVVYCGCCPWDHCPNMIPAFEMLNELGFTNAHALYIGKNLDNDWANAGFPLERPKD